MTQKVLVTGISGFAGSHLAECILSSSSYTLSGTYLSEKSLLNLGNHREKISLHQADLTDKKVTTDVISFTKPDLIFHLAALTAPGESFKHPSETITTNVSMQVNVLEAAREHVPSARILIISSADAYGMVDPSDLPIDEETPFKPGNPYSVSKIVQDYLGLEYQLAYNMQIIRVRPFNHIGPRQESKFVISAFAKQIAEIEKGKKEPVLLVGNLEAKRDFTDVRDIVRAYGMIMEKSNSGEVYNIGSGISHTISDMLDKLLSLSTASIDVKIDQSLLRPGDTPELRCDYSKLQSAIGWRPQIPLDKTLKDTLDYWRSIV
ncbi:MAG: GDP-mannose 4,6-dehydratase [Candidatus Levybacteria bacterium]|nr:GDP-mannose 4,6-dehydratase [Candidatus Levybacteria bacterium]